MLIFSIIAIIIISFLWYNTTVYDFIKAVGGFYETYRLDEESARKLPIRVSHITGLVLLLIPWFNILWFVCLLIWYCKRAAPPNGEYECIIWRLEIFEHSSFIKRSCEFVKNLIEKKIL